MKNVLRISALLTAALMVFIMIGCGGDETTVVVNPKLVSSSPANGGDMAANGSLTMTFDKAMKDVTVNGSAATVAGKVATWQAVGLTTGSDNKLTITGTSSDGGKLDETSITVRVVSADTEAPDIVGDSCNPKNGAAGVDPATVSNIVIVFTEAMGSAKVASFEPTDAKVDSKLTDDKTLTISFLGGYKLGNEMEVKVTLSGSDKAGNALTTTAYSFATMKKEE